MHDLGGVFRTTQGNCPIRRFGAAQESEILPPAVRENPRLSAFRARRTEFPKE